MSAWVALGLYLSTAAWFAISLLLNILFFLSSKHILTTRYFSEH